MSTLDPSELKASSLADLHAIADQLGLDGYRRLRKNELIEAITGGPLPADESPVPADESSQSEAGGAPESSSSTRRRRPPRSRRPKSSAQESSAAAAQGAAKEPEPRREEPVKERTADGVVELLGNGSAFLRVDPPDASDDDVYISAAQVRRCELVSGDRVAGPVRTPRRSERYPSLIRIDTINGSSADTVAEAPRFDELPVDYPSERLALEGSDATLEAIELLTPFGHGSRVSIVGPARAGKTEILRRLLDALAGREGVEITLVLSGVRPEEIGEWSEGPVAPAAALSFAASADAQSQAVERAIETAKRTAARGGNAIVLIDSLDGLHPHAARKALAAARNLRDGGSLTILATASRPFGGESTVIALNAALTSTGRLPALDLSASGTLKAELLVGQDGASAIMQARAAAGSSD